MTCPLCGGPLHAEPDAVFGCERGHALNAEQLHVAAQARATAALWMAIEALESEAAALRVVASLGSADGETTRHADRAEEDVRLLRKITRGPVPAGHGGARAER
jgi:alkylhydroperoxidase family enzyme